ncbi:MAG: transcription termination/antitermination factor NusG [Erysipelothrix sp.]|nr:transcription termination/antitermination factor NusG [Erysipelothrix sp.]
MQDKLWYVVNTYSGHENKVKENLERRVQSMGIEDSLFRVIVAEEEVIEYKTNSKGEKKKSEPKKKNLFPGYLFVEMIMTDEAWYVVRNTPGVTGFIGSSGGGAKPFPVSPEEIESILQRIGESDKKVIVDFAVGDQVKILSGPYRGKDGAVESMDNDSETAKVLVLFASQEIPAEVSYVDLERI